MERHNKQAIQQILSERDNKDFENKMTATSQQMMAQPSVEE